MAIMKFNTPPQARVPERAQQTSHGENRALQSAAFGEHVQGGANVNTLGPNIELATKWSTAPYTGDVEASVKAPEPNVWGYRDASRQGRCMANDDTCNGYATKKSGLQWCGLHAIQKAKAEQ